MKLGHGFGRFSAVPGLVGNPLHGPGKRISPKLIGNYVYDRGYGSLNVFRVLVLAAGVEEVHDCPTLGYRQRSHPCLIGLIVQ